MFVGWLKTILCQRTPTSVLCGRAQAASDPRMKTNTNVVYIVIVILPPYTKKTAFGFVVGTAAEYTSTQPSLLRLLPKKTYIENVRYACCTLTMCACSRNDPGSPPKK